MDTNFMSSGSEIKIKEDLPLMRMGECVSWVAPWTDGNLEHEQ
jgi:hypothetical protein